MKISQSAESPRKNIPLTPTWFFDALFPQRQRTNRSPYLSQKGVGEASSSLMNMRTILADPPRPETNVLVTHDPLDSTRSVRSIPWPLFTPREANMGLRHVNWCNRPLRSTRLVRRCLGARYNATGRFKSPNHSDFYHQREEFGGMKMIWYIFDLWLFDLT